MMENYSEVEMNSGVVPSQPPEQRPSGIENLFSGKIIHIWELKGPHHQMIFFDIMKHWNPELSNSIKRNIRLPMAQNFHENCRQLILFQSASLSPDSNPRNFNLSRFSSKNQLIVSYFHLRLR